MFDVRTKIFSGRFPQVLAVFTATLGAIPSGMLYGWTAPIVPILQSADTPVPIKESDVVWLENLYMVGGVAGLPITILMARLGRKKSILIAAIQLLAVWGMLAWARTVEVLFAARFIAGVAGNTFFVSAPMYIGEIADKKIRGFLTAVVYLMMLIGVVVVYCVAPFVSILASSAVGAAFLLVQIATFTLMPESPYYLLLKGKEAKAKESLQKLRSGNVEEEIEDIKAAVERQSQEKGRFVDLFTVKSNRKAIVIMTVLNGAQHFSSISVMVMNIHGILGDAASMLPPSIVAIIFSLIMLIAALTSSSFVDKTGRRILLTTSTVISGTSLLALATYFAVKNAGADISAFTWVPVVSVMLYGAGFKYGLGMMPIVLTGELFPTSVKAMGMTIADAMFVVFSFASIYLYQALSEQYGMHVPFFVFAACCYLTTLFTIFYIPETKGKTLEEIQMMLKGSE